MTSSLIACRLTDAGLVRGFAPGQPETRDWFQTVWNGMTQGEQDRVRHKAQYEHMSLRAVLQDWPTLAPPGVWHLIPKPGRAT